MAAWKSLVKPIAEFSTGTGTLLHHRPGLRRGPALAGTAASLKRLPRWKHAADFIFSQVSYSVDAQLRWRDANPADVPVYAGVMVLASAAMARRLAATIPDIEISGWLVDQVTRDKMAGVEAACQQITRLRDSGAFDGVP